MYTVNCWWICTQYSEEGRGNQVDFLITYFHIKQLCGDLLMSEKHVEGRL